MSNIFLTTIIGKEFSEDLIEEIRKQGYVLRLVHKDKKSFPHYFSHHRHERINIHIEENKIINCWIG